MLKKEKEAQDEEKEVKEAHPRYKDP